MGGGQENKEKEGNTKCPWAEETTTVSYSDAPAPAAAEGLRAEHPCGMKGVPSLGARPLPPAQPQGGWEGRASWKLLPPG